MNKNNNTTFPKKAMKNGMVLVAIGVTLAIVVMAAVLIVMELEKWQQFQAEIDNPSLLKTILVRH